MELAAATFAQGKKRGCRDQREQNSGDARLFADRQIPLQRPLAFDGFAALQKTQVGAHFSRISVAFAGVGSARLQKDFIKFKNELSIRPVAEVG